MNSNAISMGKDDIGKLLLRFSIPATTGMVVMATYNIVDTIFVGMLGVEAIAALSIALPFHMLLGALGNGTGIGAASLIARSLGSGNKEIAQNTIGQIISLSIIYGFIVALAGFYFLESFLIIFGATTEILALTGEYVIVITSGSVMFFLLMGLSSALRGEGNPKLSMYVIVLSAIINIILDPIFIFLLGMGVQGAAVATVLSKICGVIIMLYYFILGKSESKIKPSSLLLRWNTIRKIYVIGFPAMLHSISHNVSIIIVNNILAVYGYMAIAVFGIIFRLFTFALMPAVGISQGLLPIIGYNHSSGQKDRIRETLIKGIQTSTGITTFFGILFFALPTFFVSIFSREQEVIALGSHALRIMVLMFPVIGAQIVFTVYFQAVGRGLPSLLLSILREVFFFIPFMLIISFLFGLDGVWFSRPLSDLCAFVVTLYLISCELKRQGIALLNRPLSLQSR